MCDYTMHQNGIAVSQRNYLNSYGLGIVVRDSMAMNILNKIIAIEGQYYTTNNFADLVGPNTLFCDCAKGILNTSWDGYVETRDEEHNIKYYLNKNRVKCGYAWIKPSDMIKSYDVVNIHKVYIPEAGGSGTDANVLGTPFMENLEVYVLKHIFVLVMILRNIIFRKLNVRILFLI